MSSTEQANYRILDKGSVPSYLASIPAAVDVLGVVDNLDIVEIGDGNLNYVYRVSNAVDSSRSVIVKQAVPYLRMAGESWPLSRERMRYEIRALSTYNQLTPDLVPEVFHADEQMSTVVMQCLSDHIILRIGMIEGTRYPEVAEHIGRFMAKTLFATSAWGMDSTHRRELIAQFTLNSALCKLTEDFIFTFPFMPHESNYSNRLTDQWVIDNIHDDYRYKRDVLTFKELFVTRNEALLHGDLHSGSIMVNQRDTYIIDPEFAFFGPIAFEIGKVISNFLLSYTSHYYRSGGSEYQQWLLQQIRVIWQTFSQLFVQQWAETESSAMCTDGFFNEEDYVRLRSEYMHRLLQDSAGFAACSIARRTIGIAGVADIRAIDDIDVRAKLEIANLKLSKRLMAERQSLESFDDFMALIEDFHSTPIL